MLPPSKNSQPEESNFQDDVQPQESSAQPEETRSQNIEQEQIFDDKSRKPETMPLNAAIFLEMVRHKNYINGNCNPQ